MKQVNETLAQHLNTEKHFLTCDLYELTLTSGLSYYYANTDVDIAYGGRVYKSDGPIIVRNQTKINSTVNVDKLTLTIDTDGRDHVEGVALSTVAHNGGLDRATFKLKRAFFNREGVMIHHFDVFSGTCEVKGGGGLTIQLDVKSDIQNLNTEWPNRRYYPLCPYSCYSKECGVNIKTYSSRVTVQSVPEHNVVTFNVTKPDGYFTAGGIEWVSGPLVGQTTQVLKHENGKVYFMTPSSAQPHIGDTAMIYPGCDKTPATCRTKFNNITRNRATPYVPLKETIR